jgi:hypothetical protein
MSRVKLADEPCTEINVLTITATFPSLIQPWLVNQLVQIIKNGGANRILARREELGVYPDDVDRYGLNDCYKIVPEARGGLVKSILISLASSKGVPMVSLTTPCILICAKEALVTRIHSNAVIFFMYLYSCF